MMKMDNRRIAKAASLTAWICILVVHSLVAYICGALSCLLYRLFLRLNNCLRHKPASFPLGAGTSPAPAANYGADTSKRDFWVCLLVSSLRTLHEVSADVFCIVAFAAQKFDGLRCHFQACALIAVAVCIRSGFLNFTDDHNLGAFGQVLRNNLRLFLPASHPKPC